MCAAHPLHKNDTILIPAGTIHASGPGLLSYEIQQSSDITYRIYDWGRPLTEGRKLHIEQAVAVANPAIEVAPIPLPFVTHANLQSLVASPYFQLDFLELDNKPVSLNALGKTFQALTALNGKVQFIWQDHATDLNPLQTILVPAACGEYTLAGNGRLLVAGLPIR